MPRWSMAKYFSVNLYIQSFVVLKTITRQTLRFLSSVKSRIQKGLTRFKTRNADQLLHADQLHMTIFSSLKFGFNLLLFLKTKNGLLLKFRFSVSSENEWRNGYTHCIRALLYSPCIYISALHCIIPFPNPDLYCAESTVSAPKITLATTI